MKSEKGTVTLWVLGLSMVFLLFGGIAVDYWRALALQRELAAVADAAAVAAASGVDELRYRQTGEVVLDRRRAESMGLAAIDRSGITPTAWSVITEPGGTSVVVTIADELGLGLLGIFVDQSEPLLIRVAATSDPRLVP